MRAAQELIKPELHVRQSTGRPSSAAEDRPVLYLASEA